MYKLINIFRTSLSILLISLIIIFFVHNFDSLIFLRSVKIEYCIYILPFIFLAHLIASANFYILLKAKYDYLPWSEWIKYQLVKRFYNMHIPQSGNVYEAIKMKEKFGIDLLSYVSSFGAINLFVACLNCMLSLLIIIILALVTAQWNSQIIISLLLIVVFLVSAPFLLDYFLRYIRNFFFRGDMLNYLATIHKLNRTIRYEIFEISVLPKLVLLNLLFFIVGIIIFYFGFEALNVNPKFIVIIIFNIISILSGIINIVPGNIGIIEFSYGFLGSAANLTIEIGIILSILMRILTYIVFAIIYLFSKLKYR